MSSAVPAQEVIPFSQLITFVMELDKLKSVYRKTRLLNNERQENSAEHSWHFAMTAMAFAPYVEDADMLRILKMALLHDVVEIDARDVLVFDLAAREAIAEKKWLPQNGFSACCRSRRRMSFRRCGMSMTPQRPAKPVSPI